MESTKPRTELPQVLIYMVALTVGVLAALAAQLALGAAGFEPAVAWQQVFSTKAQLRTAGPWWAIVGVAFITAGLCASALSRLPLPWHRFRMLRWTLGALIVFVLAHIGHSVPAAAGGSAAAHVTASLAALAVASLMALLGAYLTVRR